MSTRQHFLFFGLILNVAFFIGCSGSSYGASTQIPDQSYSKSALEPAPVSERYDNEIYEQEELNSYDKDFAFTDDIIEGQLLAPEAQLTVVRPKSLFDKTDDHEQGNVDVNNDVASGENQNSNQNDFVKSFIVYTGYLRLRVTRLLDAIDTITKITEEHGGYIDSLTRDMVVVKIPAKDFDGVLATFIDIGDLLKRRIKANDVTLQFADLGARLAVAKEARYRLLKLLKKNKDVDERLQILQQIKRLSEQIESIESTLATIKNLVDYFTITIELEPVLENSELKIHRSPFAWINNLSAHLTSLFDGMDAFIKLPDGFVLFDEDDEYRAQSADTTVIRGAVVENEPLGDTVFWSNAIHHEMEGRGEKLVKSEGLEKIAYRIYKSDDIQPRYYLIGVFAKHADLYVIEVFFPNEESYTLHHEQVIKSLATFEVQ